MNTKQIFESEFLQAAMRRDYREMADIYEEMDRLTSYEDINEFALTDFNIEEDEVNLPSQYCFAEILPGNKIVFPAKALDYIRHFDSEYIYCLEEENIKLVAVDKELGDKYNNLIYDFFKDDGIDTRTVELTDTFILDELAMKTLGLRVGDILKLWLLNDMIVISEVDGYSHYLNKN